MDEGDASMKHVIAVALVLMGAGVGPVAAVRGTNYVLEKTANMPLERMQQYGCRTPSETKRLYDASYSLGSKIGFTFDDVAGNCFKVPIEDYTVLQAYAYDIDLKEGVAQLSIVKVQYPHVKGPVYIIAGVTAPLEPTNVRLP